MKTAIERTAVVSDSLNPLGSMWLLSYSYANNSPAEYIGHVYVRTEGIAGVLITDKEYPVRVAFSLLNKVLDEYLVKYQLSTINRVTTPNDPSTAFPELEDYIQKYQDPQQADTIMKVQQELDETKDVLQQTIGQVLARGEKLDSLMEKSDALSTSSRLFYKQAKKQNSCCVIA